ncbi:MAG: hypothetical protein ACREIZ_03690 [Candidatus Methylomirabilales bacterium]
MGQGRENAKRFLHENPAILNEIEKKLRALLGIDGTQKTTDTD